jgi:hypothetical protein
LHGRPTNEYETEHVAVPLQDRLMQRELLQVTVVPPPQTPEASQVSP